MTTELGEIYKELRRRAFDYKRQCCVDNVKIILETDDIDYRTLNRQPLTLRVEDDWDFWPSTGTYIHLPTKRKGRGVNNLIRDIRLSRKEDIL